MDGGANGSGEFIVSDNKSSSNSDVVTSMKLHICTEAFPSEICAMCIRHRGKEPNRLLSGDGDDGGGGGNSGGGFMGPITNSGGTNVAASTICRVGPENFARSTDLQPFDVFPPPFSSNPYKSPGRMGAGVVFPFTSAQWKELERQAMIYKYMISSVPVPPDLLFPLSSNFREPAGDSSATSTHSGRYPKIGDPEPWRCKRTDGKKWRCSREVAPNQKYCECHLHRGRPRSRKPVEGKVNAGGHKKTRLEQGRRRSLPSSSVQSDSSTASQKYLAANETVLLFNAKNDRSIYATCKGIARNLSITTEGGVVPRNGTELTWQHVMEANMGLENEGFPFNGSGAPTFHQDYMEQQQLLSVLSYPNFPSPKSEVPAAGFIDAWSIDNMNTRNNRIIESLVSLNEGDLSASLTLSMAMAAGNVLDEEMRSIQMGSSKTKDSLRLSWEPFARGGPLAEALPPGSIAVGGSTPASPYNSTSTPATTVSSPSGVLHRTLFSHSDGSVCNSPTLAAPPSSEAAIQWFN